MDCVALTKLLEVVSAGLIFGGGLFAGIIIGRSAKECRLALRELRRTWKATEDSTSIMSS